MTSAVAVEDSFRRIEKMVERFEKLPNPPMGYSRWVMGTSALRSHVNGVLQWRVFLIVASQDSGTREISGYGTTGDAALSACEREVERYIASMRR